VFFNGSGQPVEDWHLIKPNGEAALSVVQTWMERLSAWYMLLIPIGSNHGHPFYGRPEEYESLGYVPHPVQTFRAKWQFIYDVHTEGERVRLRWTHVDGGRGSSPMWTSTQKIKHTYRVHWCHPVFFSCKEVSVFFYQNFVFRRNKKWNIFCDIN